MQKRKAVEVVETIRRKGKVKGTISWTFICPNFPGDRQSSSSTIQNKSDPDGEAIFRIVEAALRRKCDLLFTLTDKTQYRFSKGALRHLTAEGDNVVYDRPGEPIQFPMTEIKQIICIN